MNPNQIAQQLVARITSTITARKDLYDHNYRGVEQLVARRAHNPKDARFESRLRNQNVFLHLNGSRDLTLICFCNISDYS